jgi:hypothetical protein
MRFNATDIRYNMNYLNLDGTPISLGGPSNQYINFVFAPSSSQQYFRLVAIFHDVAIGMSNGSNVFAPTVVNGLSSTVYASVEERCYSVSGTTPDQIQSHK